jgi:translocation and assembly module TamB
VAEGVRGSLRNGGHIGSLRWEQNGLVIQVRDVDLLWQPASLLNRRLQLDTLHVAELRIDDHSPPSSGATPLTEIVLPFDVDLNFGIDKLLWAGPPAFEASTLAGHYQFDRKRHTLRLDSARVAAGAYAAQGTLLARSPMTLDLQVQGKVQAPVGKRDIALDAVASLRGPLAQPNALLDLLAQIKPEAERTGTGMGATVAAQLNPWAPQPILKARTDLRQFNLALLLPDAPQTLLSGHAVVEPQGTGWQARLDLANKLAGPWDKGRLPVDGAKALVGYLDGHWNIQSLDAATAGGQIKVQAKLGQAASIGPLSGWQGQAQLQGIDPSRLYSTLAPARLDGALKAEAAKGAVVFEASIRPSGPQPVASPLQGLRLQSAAAKGQWAKGWLELKMVDIQGDDARLQGQLSLQPDTKAARGNLTLTLPGASAKVSGQLSASDGAGDMSLQLGDAARAARWAARLPYLPAALAQVNLQGNGTADLHWQGGWQQLVSGSGAEPSVQLKVQAPQLVWTDKGQTAAQALQLRDFQAEISGRLSALVLKTHGNLQQGTLRTQLQTQAMGGRSPAGAWQATINLLRIEAQDSLRPGPWTLALRQPVRLDWQPAPSGGTVLASASEAELTGPVPGAARLAWQAVRWSYGSRNELVSKGQLRSLSMAWLELLGDTQLAALGLSGNMVFDADWDVTAADKLKLRAALVRRSGDIRVLADSAPAGASGTVASGSSIANRPVIDAGVKDARLTLNADGDQLRLAVVWDSERAGEAQADLTTRVTHNADGWQWSADSPLRGTVRARLPQVGAWSVLAPPGWRVRGTLDANLAVSGTRQTPQWSGTLQADDLALRSVVDGVEFSNGRLRTSVQGQRLNITEFSLQGAGGAAGGKLTAKGFALWLPDGSGQNPALTKVRIELDATATALRVSSRADRRLSVSGSVQARLENAKLNIRGTVKADQALFILPDETAPSLGSDVVVKRPGNAEAIARPVGAAATPAKNTPGANVVTDLLLTLDLGPDFQLQGRGIATRLAGSLQLQSNADSGNMPRLTGEVRTVRGTYRAYGQNLNIETGVLRFLGAYDNPSLEILAIRPNLTQRVGVQITGNALAPRVRLYSEPELPDAEKLAWLVLGRSGANGGAEAAVLQQAAMALLGGNGKGLSGGLASSLGLDELSFAGSTTNADGTTTSGAAVTLGKRLSQNFYVAYERSLAGTLGTFSIFYDLSQRFTLRARTGAQSAVDLIFTYRYE